MASITNNNTMQYKPAEPMQASPSTAAAQEVRIPSSARQTYISHKSRDVRYSLACH